MATYILRQKPSRPKEQGIDKDESPAREIADNIRNGNRALTAWGGWSIMTCQHQIQPGDRLLFYRTEPPTGFFAVGRALRANDDKCRELRTAGLRGRFSGNPDTDRFEQVESKTKELAAFRAVSWETGKWEVVKTNDKGKRVERYYYVNAEWHVVADPDKGIILFPFTIEGRKASGYPFSDKWGDVEKICAECERSENALPAK